MAFVQGDAVLPAVQGSPGTRRMLSGVRPVRPLAARYRGTWVSRALIVNAYAVGNWGDAAIVAGIMESLRLAGVERIAVAPVDWRTRATDWIQLGADEVIPPLVGFLEVPRLLRRPRPAMLAHGAWRLASARWSRSSSNHAVAAYGKADIVVSAGGGYLGGSKPGPNFIKVANIRAAVGARRPMIVAPVTVSPASAAVGAVIRWGLAGARVFARDLPSQDVLAKLGIHGELVPDVALRAPDLRRAAGEPGRDAPRRRTGRIGWAPRDYRAEHGAWGQPELAERRTQEAMARLLSASSDRLTLIAHVRARAADDDRRAVDRVAGRFGPGARERVDIGADPATLTEAVARYADLDVLITSRMHAAIFAMAAGTPAVAIGYEPKVAGVMTDLGLGDRVVPADADLSVDRLLDLVERLRSPEEQARTVTAFGNAQERFAPFDAALGAALAGR